jgi:subtilase family serine protease
MTLVFERTAEQRSALARLLREQQEPSSSDYHRWLTPAAFADRFGAPAETIEQTKSWLQSMGFTVTGAARGRGWVMFGGTAAQIQDAFRTQIHRYKVVGKTHFAPSSAPLIPAPLARWVTAVRGLDDFHPEPHGRYKPMYTAPDGSHALAPGDIATIYNLPSICELRGRSGTDHCGGR